MSVCFAGGERGESAWGVGTGNLSASDSADNIISKDSYVSHDSTLDHAIIVNASHVHNSTVAFSTLSRSQANYTQLRFAASEACFLNDTVMQGDPDTELGLQAVDSTLSGSVVRGSASRVAHSQLEDSAADHSTAVAALVRATFLQRANATSSNFTNSMLINSSALRSEVANSTCSAGSTMFLAHVSGNSNLTNASVVNSTVINSTIINSTIVQAEVIDSAVIDGIVMRATLRNVSSTRGSLLDLVLEDALITDQEILGGKTFLNTSEDSAPSPPSVNHTVPGVPVSPEPPSVPVSPAPPPGTMPGSNGTRSMVSDDSAVDSTSRLTAAVIKGSTVTASNISYAHVDLSDVDATSMSFVNSTASTLSSTQVHGAAGVALLPVEKSHIDGGSIVGEATSIIRSNLTQMAVLESRLSDSTGATGSIQRSDADTSDMTDCTLLGAHLEGSNVAQLAVTDSEMFATLFSDGQLSGSTMTSTNANNCTVLNTTATACRLVGATLTNASLITTQLDQGTVADSRSDSSELVRVAIAESTILASHITDGVVTQSVLSDATCVRATVMNATAQDVSTLTDVTLINSTVINSTVTSSIVVNATIINSTIDSASIISVTSINSTLIEIAVEAKEYVGVTLHGTRNSKNGSSLAPSPESPSAKKVPSPSMKTASQSRPQSRQNASPLFTVGIVSGFATVLGVALVASMSLRRRLRLGHAKYDGENPELLRSLMHQVVCADAVSVEAAPLGGRCIENSYGSTCEAVSVELVATRD
ncbi:hypothetical protein CYMTET_54496 [Cymbomonas tetramitiformis]|uniref:Uncharacterized protein n=1 Tax=Cymbomonas tetramitiformis TaxID=36881 RepID=A0AAE0BF19_9CHLO|nr:hypothetical protein CYMTET_54496 [Cymbomonas tetramitiformis]